MTMRHCQRLLRLSPTSWAFAKRGVLTGWDDSRQSTTQSSASMPSVTQDSGYRPFNPASFSQKGRSFQPNDVYEYNKLISDLNYKRRPNLARDVYEDMLLDGVQPIRDTFYLLISGCMRGSRLQDVMFFFEEMKAMGLTPDATLYNCVIAACGRSLQVDQAFQIADEMEAFGLQPKHRTFLTLLRCCAISGRVDEAYGVVRRMAANGLSLDKQFYSALISAHRNRKPYAEDTVEKIFEILELSKKLPGEDSRAAAAVGSLDPQDELDDGLVNFLLDDMQSKRGFINRRLVVYHAAVAALSALGNKKAAKDVLKLVEKDGHEIDSYCILQLIKCCLAEGNFEEACAEYNKYVDSGSQPSLEIYLMVIEGALDNPSPAGSLIAQKLLMEIKERGFFLNLTLGTLLLRRACKAPRRDVAVANIVWDMMKARGVKLSKSLAREYFWALERSNTPKDDPRYLEIQSIANLDKDSKPNVYLKDGGGVSPQPSVSGQVSEDQFIQHAVEENNLLENESPINTENSFSTLELTSAAVGQYINKS